MFRLLITAVALVLSHHESVAWVQPYSSSPTNGNMRSNTIHHVDSFKHHIGRKQNSCLYQSSRERCEDMYAAVHRKEYEMKGVNAQHKSTTDPVRMALSYAQESISEMKLAKALRRVYEDKYNPANPDADSRRVPRGSTRPRRRHSRHPSARPRGPLQVPTRKPVRSPRPQSG